MLKRHGYVACVRESTSNLPDIDSIKPFYSGDEACLRDLNKVLHKHDATSRFGVNLLHSHFEMADDEVLLEETDVTNRKQTISVVKRLNIPESAIYMDRRFDISSQHPAAAAFSRMLVYSNDRITNKLQADLQLTVQDAEVLFEDVKRFIALCANVPESLAPPRVIDQGWHHFILTTKAYAQFCNDYCGRYIHHLPSDPFAQDKDFFAKRQETRELAKMVFGGLSVNWDEGLGTGPCTHNCGDE